MLAYGSLDLTRRDNETQDDDTEDRLRILSDIDKPSEQPVRNEMKF